MGSLEKEVMVTGARKILFKNDKDETISGCQVFYYDGEVNEENEVGCPVGKAWLPVEHFEEFKKHAKYPIAAKVYLDIDLTKGRLKPSRFVIK